MALASVNLSVSSACGADCVFCPADRGTRIHAKNMPFAVAKKIVDEMASPSYRELYHTAYMQIGENGDCFINKATIDILRYIKSKRPDISIHVFTDVQFFTPDKIEIVMREALLDFVGLNIDGASPQSFYATKRLKSEYTEKFIPTFVELRDKYRARTRLNILSLTMRHYVDAVRVHLGRNPTRVSDLTELGLEDDFEIIRDRISPLLRDGDTLQRSIPMFWAERGSVDKSKLRYDQYSCPLIHRVCNEAFIAPDGTWYACCFDSNNQLSFGNVYETSLREVEQSEDRRTFIRKLVSKQFAEIGGPCATVNCCQFGIHEPLAMQH